MPKLGNYITGQWIEGDGAGQPLYNAFTGDLITHASTKGLDFAAVLDYARTKGNPALRRLTFPERGRMLRALALHLREHLEEFYRLSYLTGATRADSWIDLEGGIGNLFSYASLRRKFPDSPFCLDGENTNLSKGNTFMAQHILVPKEGVAVHINAFNFPVWGMLEKIAVNLLAGVPAVVKPATVTSFLTEAVVREIVSSGILPPGALQLICGSAGDLLDHVGAQDVVTFTGSASTGLQLRSNPRILRENVPFNMEADSLNCLVLGEDVEPGMPEWDLFVKELRKEMTVKAGQKCTAVRRIFVPADKMEAAWKAIVKSLAQTTIGNPENDKVRMGSLAGQTQREEVRSQVKRLLASSQLIYGSLDSVELITPTRIKAPFCPPSSCSTKTRKPAKSRTPSKHSAPSAPSCHTKPPMKRSSSRKKAKAASAAPSSPQIPPSPEAMSWARLPGMAASSSSTTSAQKKAPAMAARFPSSSMADPAAPAAAKKWVASAASAIICSAWRSRDPRP
jgi:oxepin-CoA hydrolase / 3-oxo-5,6-dehydrosuberyl-CoA semialdehyde dehydrogenase